jgi:hypothetical protein
MREIHAHLRSHLVGIGRERTKNPPTLTPALRNSANFSTVLTFGPKKSEGSDKVHLEVMYALADGGDNGGL